MDRLLSLALRVHRTLFVVGTAILATSGSLVASDVRSAGNWSMLLGGGALMYSADIFGELEGAAQRLAYASRHDERKARSDLVRWRAPRHVLWTFVLGLVCLAAAAVLKAAG